MKTYGIVGAGGFGREVAPLASALLEANQKGPFKIVFVDDNPKASLINGYQVISTESFLKIDGDRYFNITIADSLIRQSLAERLIAGGITPFAISAANAINLSENEIGPGSILCPFTTVTVNAKIGKFFHANLYSYVAHDCVIGDYVTFAPNVQCNGGVIIEDHAYIGTGAMIKQGTPQRPIIIGKGAIIGMGAVVTKSVPPFTTVFGNPARPLRPIAPNE